MSSNDVAKLSTHVLDTVNGGPAQGMLVTLSIIGEDGQRKQLKSDRTNHDGRLNEQLLSGDELKTGLYELEFHVDEYYRKLEAKLAEPPFLTVVPIRVSLIAGQKYHVPLLCTPWSYSTYRGS